MVLPGLLIEYLVSGAIAFAWLFPILQSKLMRIDTPFLPVAFLLLYVLGMAVDYLAWILTRIPKHWIRAWVYRKYRSNGESLKQSGTLRQAKISMYAPDLAKELAMRSSRDRIARGSVVNSILATVFLLPLQIGIPLVVSAIFIWAGFERLSYGFELCAEQVVDEKLQRDATNQTIPKT